MDPLDVLTPATRAWFERAFAAPTPAQQLAWPAIASGEHVLVQAPTGSGKTLAAFLVGIDRLVATPGAGLRLLYVSPLKALNYDVERNLRGPLAGLGSTLAVGVRTGDTTQRERRQMLRTPARHPDHDPRVALPAAHLARQVDAPDGRDAHPRRGARRRRDQARRAPRALARAPRGDRRAARAADRALGDAAPARGDRPLRGRDGTADPARRRGAQQGARPRGRDPRRGHARARREPRPRPAGHARRRGDGLGVRADRSLDLAVDLPGDPRARPRAPLDDRVRQQPAAGGAARDPDQRAGAPRRRGRRGRGPAGDRPRAPRLARPRAARPDRGGSQGGADPLPRRHLEPRARDRHGRRRPRDPGREPEVGRTRPPACRPSRARAGRDLEGTDLPEVPLRPARVRGGREGDARGRDRGDPHPAQPARRPRAAGRRDRGRRGDLRRRPPRARHPRLPVRGALARAARERARHALRPLPLRRVRRAPSADRVGPHRGGRPRPHGRAAAGGDERWHDPRPGAVRGVPGRRRRARRRAGRGDGLRGARGPDLHARRLDLADRGDHARPRAREPGARGAGCRPVLEGRGRRPPVRARRANRRGVP